MDIITVFKSVSIITCSSIDAAQSQYIDRLIWVILLSNKNLKMHLISHASWTDTCIDQFIVFHFPVSIVLHGPLIIHSISLSKILKHFKWHTANEYLIL